MNMFGCDEAGRGPVLGSMFVACVSGDEEAIPDDVADSKTLSIQTIRTLAEQIRQQETIETTVIEVTTEEIDTATSMTHVSADAYADAIDDVVCAGDAGVIDAFTRGAEKAERLVTEQTAVDVDLTAEHEADTTHAHVSAASILAKEARENHVDELAGVFGEVGSGYPSDGTTKQFLEEYVAEHETLPECARESWSTSKNALEDAQQSRLSDT